MLAKQCDPGAKTGLVVSGSEARVLALLAVAYGRAIPPCVLTNIRRAARDWFGGDHCLALIHLAHSGLPHLDAGEAAPFRLFAADRLIEAGVNPRRLLELLDIDTSGLDLLKDGFDPDEPRVPAGNPDGGQWTDEGNPAIIPAAARRPAQNGAPADKDPFFDTLYAPVHDLAQRLGIDETWLLGLAAHEGGWLEQPHNREINNPFGVTHAGRLDVQYPSMDEAVAAWERRYGPIVQGVRSAENFRPTVADCALQHEGSELVEACARCDQIRAAPARLMEITARIVRLALTSGMALLATGFSLSKADIAAPDPRHYENHKYQFSLDLPQGLPACVSEHTNHGVVIYLDREAQCRDANDRAPYIVFSANYNTGSEVRTRDQRPAQTPAVLARIYCPDRDKLWIEWLHPITLGGRRAAGCRQYFRDGRISMWIATLRKTPGEADVWIEVSAYLKTTFDRYPGDMRIFRRVLKTLWIHPDGPDD